MKSIDVYEAKWEPALIHFFQSAKSLHNYPRSLLYLGGRLYDFVVMPGTQGISCLVEGNADQYETLIRPVNGKISSTCSCPVGTDCKHGLALGLLLAWEARKRGRRFPSSVLTQYQQAFKKLDGADQEIPEVEEVVGVSRVVGTTIAKDWWKVIIANGPWGEQEAVLQKVVKGRLPGSSFWDINNVLRTLQDVKNPIRRLKSIDMAIENFYKRHSYRRPSKTAVDGDLVAFLASAEATDIEASFDRDLARTDLIDWLKKVGSEGDLTRGRDRMDLVWYPLEIHDGFCTVVFQMLVDAGQRGLLARKGNSLHQIAADAGAGKRDFGPTRNQLVAWISDTHNFLDTDPFQVGELGDETMIFARNFYQWITLWGSYTRWVDGGTVSLLPQMADLTISASESGDLRWVIKVPATGNGGALEIPFQDSILYVDRPDRESNKDTSYNYYLRIDDGLIRVDTHGMSPLVLRAARKLGSVPIDSITESGAGGALLQVLSNGSRSAEGLENWIREIPCRGEVSLAVDGKSGLRVTAKARAMEDGGRVFVWLPETGWRIFNARDEKALQENAVEGGLPETDLEHSSNGEETAGGVDGKYLQVLPRRQDVEGLERWLESVASLIQGTMVEDGETPSFEGRFQAGDFLPVWFQRPGRVEFYGNAEFRKLVAIRLAPRISVSSESSGLDWLKVSVALENEISDTSLVEMTRLLAANSNHFVRLPGGGIYRRGDLEAYVNQVNSLNMMGLTLAPGEQKLHALHLAGTPADTLSQLEASGGAMAALAEKSRKILQDFSGIPNAEVPSTTKAFLRPYQQTGVNFLTWSACHFGGALLADDMGLGKTLQMLATIGALREAAKGNDLATGPNLVICPASVAHNWEREAHRFAPDFKVIVLESGAGRQTHLAKLAEYDLVIMNFALLRRDIAELQKIPWFVIVADEAQAIKNPNSESSRAIKQLEARHRFALTGTPIENRIADLYSIVEFALPGYLGDPDKSFSSADPESAAQSCRLLRAQLRPVLMRRLKVEVAPELPERVETRIDCEMPAAQRKLYAAEVKRVRLMLDGMGKDNLKGKHRIEMLAALMRLRQICCDPILVGHPEIESGKTDELMELIPSLLEAGHKVLIFSQFVRMLNHLEEQLAAKEIRTFKLTGATKNRRELVDSFENDKEPAAFLISLKAGGTGLNLVSASHVILFDPWWNPSVEAQAIDRTHRIGQDKTVVAYRLVTTGTIEERILELQETKRALVKNILEEDSFNRTLTSEDFQYLLGG